MASIHQTATAFDKMDICASDPLPAPAVGENAQAGKGRKRPPRRRRGKAANGVKNKNESANSTGSSDDLSEEELIRALARLPETFRKTFNVGFTFPDGDLLETAHAVCLCRCLGLRGSMTRDQLRVNGLIRVLMSECSFRCQYLKGQDRSIGQREVFFEDIKKKLAAVGLPSVEGKLRVANRIQGDTCEALVDLFVKARQTYLREVIDEEKEGAREPVMTKKKTKLIQYVDRWIAHTQEAYLTKDEEKLAKAIGGVSL